VGEIILLPIEGKGEKRISVKNLENTLVLLTVNYTNERIAQELKEEGVPLVEHKDIEESKMRSLRQKAYHSFKFGGNATKLYIGHQLGPLGRCVIEGTGHPLFQQHKVSVKASELVKTLLATFKERRCFMRTRRVLTEMGIRRGRKLMKFKTMLFLAKECKFSKRNTIEIQNLPLSYQKLIEASFWLGGIFSNPDCISIELTGRQPDVPPTHRILFQL
jgi:hypothetical protein